MIIIDACVAVKLFVSETDSGDAERIFERDTVFIAPDLIIVEVANALRKAWRRGIVDADHMDRAISRLPTIFSRLVPTPDLVADAAVISRILQHPIPDCVYAALNWRTGAPVITADEGFIASTSAVSAWRGTAIRLRDFAA